MLQTEFLLCMHKRMEDILKQAELVAHCVAAGTAAGQQDGEAPLACDLRRGPMCWSIR